MHLYLALYFFKYHYTKIGLSIRPVDDCHKEVKHIVCVSFSTIWHYLPSCSCIILHLINTHYTNAKKTKQSDACIHEKDIPRYAGTSLRPTCRRLYFALYHTILPSKRHPVDMVNAKTNLYLHSCKRHPSIRGFASVDL